VRKRPEILKELREARAELVRVEKKVKELREELDKAPRSG